MSAKRNTDIKPYMITCDTCGATVDANTKNAAGWTIVPFVRCPCCKDTVDSPFFEVPSSVRGKVIRVPYNGEVINR